MEQKSLTALISAFSRAYHALNNEVTIFNDSLARDLLTDEEFNQIAKNMSDGIGFFNPSFVGEPEQALRWVVDNQLSPSPLGRAAFAEKSLEWAVRTGTEQYLIWGAGYDTFAYRQPLWAKALQIFEVDHPATARDKQERLKSAGIVIPDNVHYIEADFTKGTWKKEMQNHNSFNSDKISYCSILGVAYYLSKESFESVISSISGIVAKGSSIIKTNYPVTPRQKRSRCRSNRGIIDSPTPLFTPFCRFRYRSRGQIHSHQYPRTSSTNDPFLKWFSYASRMMRIAMSTSPF